MAFDRRRRRSVASFTAFTLAGGSMVPAWAAPAGGRVVAGDASIAQSGTATTIRQSTDRVAIDWQSFGIAANESVRFLQPSSSSIALNRILGQDPSVILGSLSANGQVFLLNPNGVLFGRGAQVDVGGLVASTLNLTNENFMAGRYAFDRAGATGGVVNQGEIRADGGLVAFLAPEVRNEGTIRANGGAIALAAAERVTLNLEGNRFLGLTVARGALQALAENRGMLKADGGQVLLTAKAADALVKSVVNQDGVIEAQTLASVAGRIVLLAEGGETQVAGRLDASAPNGGDGGFVETSGDRVKVASGATITTAAPNGKTGTWLVDPTDFTVAASGGDIDGATLGTQLGANNVTLATSAAGAGNGDIFVNDTVTWANANTLTLNAHHNVDFSGGGTLNGGGTGNVTLNAGLNGTSGAIVGHASNTVVTGSTLVANALTGIGSSATPLSTQVANAALVSAQSGGIFAVNAGNLTVAGRSANGDINVRTASGADVATGPANRGGNITVGTVGGVTGLSTTGSGNVGLTAGNGGGNDGSGLSGGDGGSVTLGAALAAAGSATLTGGNGGYAGSGISFGGAGGSVNVNASLNAAGVRLSAGNGGRATEINSTGTSTGGVGGGVTLSAAVNSSLGAIVGSGPGGQGGQNSLGPGHGGNGGAVTINASLTAAQALVLSTGDGGRGNQDATGAVTHPGAGGSGGAIALNAALASGQSITLGTGGGGESFGGAGGSVSSSSAGIMTAAAAISIAAGNGEAGRTCLSALCAAGAAGTDGGAGGSIDLAGALVSGGAVTLTAGSGRSGGTGTDSLVSGLAGGAGGAGGMGGSITTGAISAQGNVAFAAGTGAVGGLGGQARANANGVTTVGGDGGIGGAGGSITVNGVLTGQAVSLQAGHAGQGSAGGRAFDSSNNVLYTPAVSAGGVGGRGGDGGSVLLNSSVTAAGTASVIAGLGGVGGTGGASDRGSTSSTGGAGVFGGAGGSIGIHAALSAGGNVQLTGGNGGNGGSGGNETSPTGARQGGAGGSGGDGGMLTLDAPITSAGSVELNAGTRGNGRGGGGSVGGTQGSAGAAGVAGAVRGGNIDVTAASDLSFIDALLPDSGNVRLRAGVNGGFLNLAQSALSAGANDLTLEGYVITPGVTLALTGNTVNLKTGTGVTAAVTSTQLNVENTTSGDVVVTNTGHINVTGAASNLNTAHLVSTGGDITLGAAINASGTGDAVRLAGTRFVNNAGAAALSTPNGRWVVWSATPVNDGFGGLQSGNAAAWSSAYPGGAGATLVAAGNRYAFSIAQPAGQAIVRADDKAKTYGDLFTGFTFSAFDAGGGNSYGNAFTDPGGTPALVGTPLLASAGAAATATRTGGNAGGAGYDITVDLTGVSAAGYTLQGVNGLLTVNPRTVAVAADAKSLTYGNAPQALTYTATGLAGFDSNATAFTGALARTAGANSSGGYERIGTSAITQGSLAANANYTLTGFTGANYVIAQRGLAVTATAQDKEYDGGTAATVAFADNRLSGDVFAVSGSGAFADKTVATGKTVTVSGIGISGADAGNYTANTSTTATANISARTLTVGFTGVNKVYDATAAATVATTDDRVAGDALVIARNASFLDSLVGTGKTVNVTGVALSGGDAGNYTLAGTTATTSADITLRPLSITANSVSKIVNDPLPPFSATYAGFAPGEGTAQLTGTLALTTSATAISPPGSYAIVPSGLAGSNYAITYVNGTLAVGTPNDPQLLAALSSVYFVPAPGGFSFTLPGPGLQGGGGSGGSPGDGLYSISPNAGNAPPAE